MKQKKMYFIRRYKTKNMIFVNSCNLSKKSSLYACEEKGIKETNETKKHKKENQNCQAMFD